MTSHIRIPEVSPVAQAMADGAKSVFSFPFPIFKAADIEVRANSTLLTSGYSVVGEGSSTGGAVIFTAAPANGVRITLRRRQTYARTDDFLDERAPTPHELNDAVDQNVAAIQELAEQASRAVTRPLSADLSQPLDLSLPNPEAGKVIGWNGSADALVNVAQVDVSDVLHKSQNLADLADKAQARINLGLATVAASGSYADLTGKPVLGSAAAHADTDFATAAQGAKADSALQSSDIGVSVQAHDSDLDWVAANLSAAGRALIDDADAAAQRATLGLATVASSGTYADLTGKPVLGSAAYKDIGTSGANVPLLSTANTYGAPQTPSAQVLTDAATVSIAITAQVWTLSTAAARTIGAPTGGVANTFYFLEIASNGFTPSWASAFDFGAAGAPTSLSGTCGFDIFYDGAKYRISTRFTGGV
ncbi:hypothetical protein [Paramagnetospirillum magneticum]|nr:hypothetical protein [Paramagnetospirillum magneticum]